MLFMQDRPLGAVCTGLTAIALVAAADQRHARALPVLRPGSPELVVSHIRERFDSTVFEPDDYYARLHTERGSHLIRLSLTELEQRLNPRTFIRVHRGALVNRAWVRCLVRDRSAGHSLIVANGTRVPISERRCRAVRDWLDGVPQ